MVFESVVVDYLSQDYVGDEEVVPMVALFVAVIRCVHYDVMGVHESRADRR